MTGGVYVFGRVGRRKGEEGIMGISLDPKDDGTRAGRATADSVGGMRTSPPYDEGGGMDSARYMGAGIAGAGAT